MELALRLLFKNDLSGPMKQAVQQAEKDLRPLTDSVDKLDQAFTKTTKKAADSFSNLGIGLGQTAKKVEEVATVVEKQATRMQRAMELVNKATSMGAQGVKAWGQVAAGYEAGKYILGQPVGRAMDYDLRMAHLANTAYSGQSLAERQAGMKTMDQSIQAAVRFGGGTREGAADTLDALIASGAVNPKAAQSMLPSLMRASTAANADPTQLAGIAIRSMQSFGIKSGEIGGVLDMALTAGQAGGFELKDMARWLPTQMAAARLSGLNGLPGLAKLLAANQAVAITSGSKDDAGNNLRNLLLKINSNDTAKDAKKLGVDLSGTLAAARGKGVDSLSAFVGLVDHIAGQDKTFMALRAKAANGGGNAETYAAQADILQGSAIGKIIQDQQALLGLVGLMNNREYMAGVEGKLGTSKGATASAHALVAGTQSYKATQLAAEKQFSESKAFDSYGGLLGKATEGLTEFARTYPNLTAGATAAATALTALAGVAGAAGLVGILQGKVSPADLLKKPGQVLGQAKSAVVNVAKSPAKLGGVAAGVTAIVGGGILIDKVNEYNDQQELVEDYRMAQKGLRRKKGTLPWQSDMFAPINNKGEQDALIKRLAEEIAKMQISVQIDGREVAKSVNQTNSQDGRRQ